MTRIAATALLLVAFLPSLLHAQDTTWISIAKSGDVAAMQQWVAAGGDVNARDEHGAPVLMWAATSGNVELMRYLVAQGADATQKGVIWLDEEQTGYYGNLMGVAAGMGYVEILRYLVEEVGLDIEDRERDPETGEDTGWRALQWAASAGEAETTALLLEAGAATELPSDEFDAPILLGVHFDTVLDLLVSAGASMNSVENDGSTVLHYLAEWGDVLQAQRVLEVGADINAMLKSGLTPLILATLNGEEAMVRLLLCSGAEGKETAITLAENEGHVSLVPLLKSASCDEEGLTKILKATQLSSEVVQLYYEGRYEEAIAQELEAALLRKEVLGENHPDYAISLSNLAELYRSQGQYATAESLYKEEMKITLATLGKDHPDYAISLNNLAALYNSQGRYEEAEAMFKESRDITRAAFGDNHPDFATSLNNLAAVYNFQGLYEEAEALYKESRDIRQAMLGEDHPDYATSLNNLAEVYRSQGRYTESEALYKESREIRRTVLGEDHPDYATSLNNLAVLYRSLGRFAESEALYKESREIRRTVLGEDHPDYATSLNNLAMLYESQGRYIEAEPLYVEDITITKAVLGENHPDYATSLNNLAVLYESQGRYLEAETLFKESRDVTRTVLGKDHPDYAISLNNLAELYRTSGRYVEAEPLYEESRDIRRGVLGEEHPAFATSLNNLALLYLLQGRYEEAEPIYKESLDITRATLGGDHPDYAMSLNNLAYLGFFLDSGSIDNSLARFDSIVAILELPANRGQNLELRVAAQFTLGYFQRFDGEDSLAIRNLQKAISIVEEQRIHIGGSEMLRARFLEKNSQLYTTMMRWLIEDGELEEAFFYLERGRTRTLLDQMATARIDVRESIPESQRLKLTTLEDSARAMIAEFNTRISTTRSNTFLDEERRRFLIDSLAIELGKAQDFMAEVDHDIKNASPLYQETIAKIINPPSIDSLRQTVVPEDGYLLSYSIEADTSFVFGISQKKFWVEPLIIQDSAFTTAVLDSLLFGVEAGIVTGRTRSGTDVTPVKNPMRRQNLHTLFQALIPETRREALLASHELIVIPDGNLYVLPFDMLAIDSTAYWVDKGPLVRYAPSATVLHVQANENTPVNNSTGFEVLTLSDPVYSANDVDSLDFITAYKRSDFERRTGGYGRLPHTADETQAILEAYGDSTKVKVLNRSAANEAAVRMHLSDKRYVHFATHGLTEEMKQGSQGLFSALVLTPPPPGMEHDDENDGFLELREIYQLGKALEGLELAVLSACETHVGPQFKGEGVFALSRGFMTAGANRVIASQWQVDDAATGRLIGKLFEEILAKENKGEEVDYAAALRAAQLEVKNAEGQNWSDPYYWAPFVLIGGR